MKKRCRVLSCMGCGRHKGDLHKEGCPTDEEGPVEGHMPEPCWGLPGHALDDNEPTAADLEEILGW